VTQVIRDWHRPEIAIQVHNHAGSGLAWADERERAVVAAFSEAECAAQTLPMRPKIDLDPETVSRSQSRLRDTVENQRLADKQ